MLCALAFLQGRKFLAFGLISLSILVITLYQTKTGIIGCIAGTIAMISITKISKATLYKYVIFSSLLIFTAAALFTLGAFDSLLSRGSSHRIEIYNLIIQEYINCGNLIGCGYNYEIKSILSGGEELAHAHSIYLSQLLFFGLPSLVLLIALQVKSYFLARKYSLPISCGIIASSTVFLVDGGTIINNPDPIWVLFWLPLAVIDGLSSESTKLKTQT